MIVQPPFFARSSRRAGALLVTLVLHVLLAALFLLRQSVQAPASTASWIDMIQVAPRRPAAAAPTLPPPARRPKPATAVHAPASTMPARQPPVDPGEAVTEVVFPDAPPAQASAFELARAAAGGVDKQLRKESPERSLLRSTPRTDQQKLAEGIARSIRAPKFYEPARITKVQDQGTGWGRRIEKVETAFGTYCVTYESNHGGDGRDPFKDALQPKLRKCPREE